MRSYHPARPLFLAALLAGPSLAQSQMAELRGVTNGESLGWAVVSLGDLDGDGVPDFAVSSPSNLPLGTGTGGVGLYSGATLVRSWWRTGATDLGDFGYALANAGDQNGDLLPDLLVGSPDVVPGGGHAPGTTPGYAVLLSGANGAVLQKMVGDSAGDMFGFAVAVLADVDGDGVRDYAVGAPGDDDGGGDAGSVRIVSGFDRSQLLLIHGPQAGCAFGSSLATLPDLDGDGVEELAVGAPEFDHQGEDAGAVFLCSGATGQTLHAWYGPEAEAFFGNAVAALGDLDGDGFGDLGIGAYDADAPVGISAGAVFVHSSVTQALLWTRHGDAATYWMGRSVAPIEDVDGNGTADVLVGANASEEGFDQAGQARVLSGATGADLGRIYGGAEQEYLGTSVASLGDLDGDGHPEFAAGGMAGYEGAQRGVLRILSTDTPMPPSSYCIAKLNSQGCLPVLASQGTPTLSGPDDFVLTATGVINQKPGGMLWSLTGNNEPFYSATLCVAAPIKRTPVTSSGGNSGSDDCSGELAFHFSQAYMVQQGLGAGTLVHVQCWYRDPGLPFAKIGLSQGVAFFVAP